MNPKMQHLLDRIRALPALRTPYNNVSLSPHPDGELIFSVPFECWRMPERIPIGFMLNMYSENERTYTSTYIKGEEPNLGALVRMETEGAFYHCHDYFEFTYVIDGRYSELVINNDTVLNTGELTLLDFNSIHRVQTNPVQSDILYLSFNRDYLTRELMGVCSPDLRQFFETAMLGGSGGGRVMLFTGAAPSQVEETEEALAGLMEELINRKPGYEQMVKGYMVRFFAALAAGYRREVRSAVGSEERLLMLHEVTAFIREHLDTVSAELLEERFHYGRNYYNRLFRELAGCSYSDYLRRARLEQAEFLLKTSDLPIREIARSVGYENREFFYRIFREAYGVTPNQFRAAGA